MRVGKRAITSATCRWSWIVAILLAAASGAAHASAGFEQQPLVSGTDLVQVDVSVLDDARHPVTDLEPDAFAIFEDGKRRPVSAFAVVEAGAVKAQLGTSADGNRSGALSTGLGESPEVGRLVIILMDRSIPVSLTPAARVIAASVVNALGPGDRAAVIRSSGFTGDGLQQEFTTDRAALLRAIASPFMGATTPPNMTSRGLEQTTPRRGDHGECECGACVLDRLRVVAAAVRDVALMRKVLFFIGADVPSGDGAGLRCLSLINDARKRLFKELDAGNLTIHSFDPSGLETESQDAASLRNFTSGARRAYGMDRRNALALLPDHTGGRTVVNTNAPQDQVVAALGESRVYYLLGFEPARPADGRMHRIEVRVSDHRVKTLRWRQGYLASPTTRR